MSIALQIVLLVASVYIESIAMSISHPDVNENMSHMARDYQVGGFFTPTRTSMFQCRSVVLPS